GDDHAGQRQVGSHGQIDRARQDHDHLPQSQHHQDGGVVEDGQQVSRLGKARKAQRHQNDHRHDGQSQPDLTIFQHAFHAASSSTIPAARRTSVSGLRSLLSNMSTTSPSRMTTMRSLMPSTSGSSEETMMTLNPCATSSPMNSCTAALEPISMPLVGSARVTSLGQ